MNENNWEQVLADFQATKKVKPNLSDSEWLEKFPEFNNDKELLQAAFDYDATVKSGKYKTKEELQGKFPEFWPKSQPTVQIPMMAAAESTTPYQQIAGQVPYASLLKKQEEKANDERQMRIDAYENESYLDNPKSVTKAYEMGDYATSSHPLKVQLAIGSGKKEAKKQVKKWEEQIEAQKQYINDIADKNGIPTSYSIEKDTIEDIYGNAKKIFDQTKTGKELNANLEKAIGQLRTSFEAELYAGKIEGSEELASFLSEGEALSSERYRLEAEAKDVDLEDAASVNRYNKHLEEYKKRVDAYNAKSEAANEKVNELFSKYMDENSYLLKPYYQAMEDGFDNIMYNYIEDSVKPFKKQAVGKQIGDTREMLSRIIKESNASTSPFFEMLNQSNQYQGGNKTQYIDSSNIQDSFNYKAAMSFLKDSESMLKAYDKGTKLGEMVEGINGSFKQTGLYDWGISDMMNNIHLRDVLDKLNEGQDPNAISGRDVYKFDQDIFKKNLEGLTQSEKALYDAYVNNILTIQNIGADLSGWYDAGKVTANMIPFILQMYVSGGLAGATKLGAKATAKGYLGTFRNAAKNVFGKELSQLTTKELFNIAGRQLAGASVMGSISAATVGAAGTVNNFIERTIGTADVDLDLRTGEVKYEGQIGQEARNFITGLKAFGQRAIEFQSEGVGSTLEAFGGRVMNWMTRGIASKKGFKFLTDTWKLYEKSGLGTMMDRANMQGFFGEFGEEMFGALENCIFGLESFEDAFSPEAIGQTALGLLPAQMLFSGVGFAKGANINRRHNKALRLLSEKEDQSIVDTYERIYNDTDIERKPIILNEILSVMEDKEMPSEKKSARIYYLFDSLQKSYFDDIAAASEEKDARSYIEEMTSRLNNATGNVDFVEFEKDGNKYVGTLMQTIDDNGKVSFVVRDMNGEEHKVEKYTALESFTKEDIVEKGIEYAKDKAMEISLDDISPLHVGQSAMTSDGKNIGWSNGMEITIDEELENGRYAVTITDKNGEKSNAVMSERELREYATMDLEFQQAVTDDVEIQKLAVQSALDVFFDNGIAENVFQIGKRKREALRNAGRLFSQEEIDGMQNMSDEDFAEYVAKLEGEKRGAAVDYRIMSNISLAENKVGEFLALSVEELQLGADVQTADHNGSRVIVTESKDGKATIIDNEGIAHIVDATELSNEDIVSGEQASMLVDNVRNGVESIQKMYDTFNGIDGFVTGAKFVLDGNEITILDRSQDGTISYTTDGNNTNTGNVYEIAEMIEQQQYDAQQADRQAKEELDEFEEGKKIAEGLRQNSVFEIMTENGIVRASYVGRQSVKKNGKDVTTHSFIPVDEDGTPIGQTVKMSENDFYANLSKAVKPKENVSQTRGNVDMAQSQGVDYTEVVAGEIASNIKAKLEELAILFPKAKFRISIYGEDILKRAKEARANGNNVEAYFDGTPGKKEVVFILPDMVTAAVQNGMDVETYVMDKFIHECVIHDGLRQLLGRDTYEKLCSNVFNTMLTDEEKAMFYLYVKHEIGRNVFESVWTNLSQEEKDKIIADAKSASEDMKALAGDEYIAFTYETKDIESIERKTFIEKVVEIIKKLAEKMGLEWNIDEKHLSQILDQAVKMSFDKMQQSETKPSETSAEQQTDTNEEQNVEEKPQEEEKPKSGFTKTIGEQLDEFVAEYGEKSSTVLENTIKDIKSKIAKKEKELSDLSDELDKMPAPYDKATKSAFDKKKNAIDKKASEIEEYYYKLIPFEEMKRELDERIAKYNEEQERLSNEIDDIVVDVRQAIEDATTIPEPKEDSFNDEDKDIYELIARMLGRKGLKTRSTQTFNPKTGKITNRGRKYEQQVESYDKESFKKETGWGDTEMAKFKDPIQPFFVKEGGMTFNDFVQSVVSEAKALYLIGEDADDYDVKNAILEVLHDVSSLKELNNYKQMHRRSSGEYEAQKAALDYYAQQDGYQDAEDKNNFLNSVIDEKMAAIKENGELTQQDVDELKKLSEDVKSKLYESIGYEEPTEIQSSTDVNGFDWTPVEDIYVPFSLVGDQSKIDELEKGEKKIGYRTVVKNTDGTYGSPMAGKLGSKGTEKVETSSFELNKHWIQSEEHPELATDDGKIDLIKPNGIGTVGSVDYDPYQHIRLNAINKQFTQAWMRPELVYIRTLYPASELTSGYKAEKAKLAVGLHDWNNGQLVLSRYEYPLEEVPWEEVADMWAEEFKDSGVTFDIVSPHLLKLLVDRGVKILPPKKAAGAKAMQAYNEWEKRKEENENVRFSITAKQDSDYMNAVKNGDMETAARMVRDAFKQAFPNTKVVDENGEPLLVYHGTKSNFWTFDILKANGRALGYGFYFAKNKSFADIYGDRVIESYIDIKKPIVDDKKTITINQVKSFIKSLVESEIKEYEDDELSWKDTFISNYVDTYKTSQNNAIKEVASIIYENNESDNGVIYEIANVTGKNHSPKGIKGFYRVLKDSIGYDGYISTKGITDNSSSVYVVFNPNQIKSADPVTYDDNGNVIPLSERFNSDNDDIRFSLSAYAVADEMRIDIKKAMAKLPKQLHSETIARDLYEFNSMLSKYISKIENYEFKKYGREIYAGTPIRKGRFLNDSGKLNTKVTKESYLMAEPLYREYLDAIDELERTHDIPKEAQAFIDEMRKMAEDDINILLNIAEGNEEYNDKWTRFSLSGKPVFVSNAYHAVEGIKQEKATPEQWLAMLKKNGGLKAEEDKWIGLTDWINSQDKKSVTKKEVLDYIAQNAVEVDEVKYSDELNIIENNEQPINETRLEYTTKGLINKREIALTVPTIEPYNKNDEVHFGDAGEGRAVAWIRFGETTDNKGNRVLVIDEIQSKRHQDGHDKGYISKESLDLEKKYREIQKELNQMSISLMKKYGDAYVSNGRKGELSDFYTEEEKAQIAALNKNSLDLQDKFYNSRNNESIIPDAPFQKTWNELAMKRMLRYAAENGYDKVAWTTGEQQADRYDLSNKVDSVIYKRNDDGTYKISALTGGRGNRLGSNITEEKLADYVGKEIAQKILNTEGEDMPVAVPDTLNKTEIWKSLHGGDLKIGGEGMKGFYDKMLPQFMDKYGKKWGVKTKDITLELPNESDRVMHSVDVTEEMKESVMDGQLMFSIYGNLLETQIGGNPESEEYDEKVANFITTTEKKHLDGAIPLKRLQTVIAKNSEVDDSEDVYNAFIARGSRGQRLQENVAHLSDELLESMKPFIEKHGIKGKGFNENVRDLQFYVMCKHGLERNAYMHSKLIEEIDNKYNNAIDVLKSKKAELEKMYNLSVKAGDNEEINNAKEKLEKIDQKINSKTDEWNKERSQEPKDYSGLTSIIEKVFGDRADFTGGAQEIIDIFENNFDSKDIDNLWKSIGAISEEIRNQWLLGGLIDQETKDEFASRYKYYVPLRGFDEKTTDEIYDSYYNRNGGGIKSGLDKAKGRKSMANDPFSNLTLLLDRAIDARTKNEVLQKLLNLATNHPNNKLLTVSKMFEVKSVDENGNVTWTISNPVEIGSIEYKAMMADVKVGNARPLQHVGTGEKVVNESHIKVYMGGKAFDVVLNGNPAALKPLRFINENGTLNKITGSATRFLSKFMTTYKPDFILKNGMRDFLMASFMTKTQLGPKANMYFKKNYANVLGNIVKLYNTDSCKDQTLTKYWNEWRTGGGETGFTRNLSQERVKKNMFGELERQTRNLAGRVAASPRELIKGIGGLLETTNGCVEDATRFAVYVTSREMGLTEMQSLSNAKNFTANFSKRGDSAFARFMSSNFAFYNAALQGVNSLAHAFKNNPSASIFASMAAVGTQAAMGVINFMLLNAFGDDDDWRAFEDMTPFISNTNFLLFVPKVGPIDSYILTIPFPQDMIPILSLSNIVTRNMLGWNSVKNDATGVGASIFYQWASTMADLLPVNPMEKGFGNGNDWKQTVRAFAPTYISPIADVVLNRDFMGGKIRWKHYTDDGAKDLKPYWADYDREKSPLAYDIAKFVAGGDQYEARDGWLNWHPKQIEHIVLGYSNGIGSIIGDFSKLNESIKNGNVSVNNIPVAKKIFIAPNPLKYDANVSRKLYEVRDMIDKCGKRENEINKYIDDAVSRGDEKSMNKWNKRLEDLYGTLDYRLKSVFGDDVKDNLEGFSTYKADILQNKEIENEQRNEELSQIVYSKAAYLDDITNECDQWLKENGDELNVNVRKIVDNLKK